MYQRDVLLTEEPGVSGGMEGGAKWRPRWVSQRPLQVEASIIESALRLFFSKQDPQFLFIHREAFLEDYYENSHAGKYWSYPLLYAICALGVKFSSDSQVRSKSVALFHCAENDIMSHALGTPHITVAQTLLCMAFYELSGGNHSKGWVLAGTLTLGQKAKPGVDLYQVWHFV